MRAAKGWVPPWLNPLFGLAVGLGKHVMVAGIDSANPASIRLHKRLGIDHAGMLRKVGVKFGRWLDLPFMRRFLDAPSESASGYAAEIRQ